MLSKLMQSTINQVCKELLLNHNLVLFTTVGQECEDAIATSESTGVLTSPGYPDNYPTSTDCAWNIAVPQGYIVTVDFTFIDLEPTDDGSSCYDFVQVGTIVLIKLNLF